MKALNCYVEKFNREVGSWRDALTGFEIVGIASYIGKKEYTGHKLWDKW